MYFLTKGIFMIAMEITVLMMSVNINWMMPMSIRPNCCP